MRHSFRPFDEEEAAFLGQATGVDFSRTDFARPDWLCVSCHEEGRLLGLCAFEFKSPFDAHFSIAIRDRRCITRRVMRAMFKAVFSRAARVTALIAPGNAAALLQARRMGFEDEGFMRLAIEGRQDAILLGMTEDTCRYLRASPGRALAPGRGFNNGQQPEAA